LPDNKIEVEMLTLDEFAELHDAMQEWTAQTEEAVKRGDVFADVSLEHVTSLKKKLDAFRPFGITWGVSTNTLSSQRKPAGRGIKHPEGK
jgi:hypothetical protein